MDWKIFFIAVVLFAVLLSMPTPDGMKDVGTEYRVRRLAVIMGGEVAGVIREQDLFFEMEKIITEQE